MKQKRPQRKVSGVCTGAADRFGEEKVTPGPCSLYLDAGAACKAVRSKKLSLTFEEGRCLIVLIDFLRIATEMLIWSNPDVYVDKEESEDINVDGLVRRLGRAGTRQLRDQ